MSAATYFKTEQTTGRSIQRDRGIPENRWWVPIYRDFRHHEERIKKGPRVTDDFCEGTPEDRAFRRGREDVVDGRRSRGYATGAQHDAYVNGRRWQELRDKANGIVRKKPKTVKAILKEMREKSAQERKNVGWINPPQPEPEPKITPHRVQEDEDRRLAAFINQHAHLPGWQVSLLAAARRAME